MPVKTLDEVIKAYEICHASILDCDGCPYDNGMRWRDSDCYIADAIHYLQAYRANQQTYVENSRKAEEARERYMEAVRNCEHVCLKAEKVVLDAERNDPLTWDELKEMVDKPVWIEEKYSLSNEWHGRWEVIRNVWDNEGDDDPYISMTNDEYRHMDDMGERWQAYRKERG